MVLHKVLSHNVSPAQTPGFTPDMCCLFLPPPWGNVCVRSALVW